MPSKEKIFFLHIIYHTNMFISSSHHSLKQTFPSWPFPQPCISFLRPCFRFTWRAYSFSLSLRCFFLVLLSFPIIPSLHPLTFLSQFHCLFPYKNIALFPLLSFLCLTLSFSYPTLSLFTFRLIFIAVTLSAHSHKNIPLPFLLSFICLVPFSLPSIRVLV